MSQDAADALHPDVVTALAPEVPPERVYGDRRGSRDLPHAWVYGGDVTPSRPSWETSSAVYCHVWANSRGEANDLARKLRPMQHKRYARKGSSHGIRFGRPTEVVVDEEDAVHLTMRFPVLSVEVAAVSP